MDNLYELIGIWRWLIESIAQKIGIRLAETPAANAATLITDRN